jgi:hypothetical protein
MDLVVAVAAYRVRPPAGIVACAAHWCSSAAGAAFLSESSNSWALW